ncbi:MAG TPA: STAS domain-containing protein [Acidimicrobiales bacterium]|nr:STAS domain-containing protein [Acidimicrobiales bacterium]
MEVASADGETIVTARGDIDVTTAPKLRAAFLQAQTNGRSVADRRVVVDMSGVTFLNASGLGVLAGAAVRARRAGGELLLRNPTPMTVRLLEITGLLQIFRLERRHRRTSALPTFASGPTLEVA